MEQKKWKIAFDSIRLSTEEKENLWGRIEQHMTEKGNDKKQLLRVAVLFAVICCICLGACAAISGLMDGKLVDAFAKLWKTEESSQKIIRETTDYHLMLDDVYAPELIECSKTRVIFANSFGLVIYDKEQQQVTGTIDLQEIHCNFFNADTLQTKFLIEQDSLTIYNLSQRKVTEMCYVYDLGECAEGGDGNIAALQASETKIASSLLEKKWKQQNKERRVSTFEEYCGENPFAHKMYSEYSIRWSEDENTTYCSCLVIDGMEQVLGHASKECQVMLYHKNQATGEITREALRISTERGEEAENENQHFLPKYQYLGEDLVQRALVRCFQNDFARYNGYQYRGRAYSGVILPDRSDVVLPIIDIAGTKKEGDILKVYGVFRWEGYSLSGDTLYCALEEGGGEGGAYLKKTDYGYEVKKIVHPRDGSYFYTDMIKLCDGDEKMASRCHISNRYSALQKRVLKKYVKQNDLDIKYFKDFGRDPIELQ